MFFEIFDVSVLSAKDVYIYIYIYIYVCTNRLLSDTDIHDMTNLSISTYMAWQYEYDGDYDYGAYDFDRWGQTDLFMPS